MFVNNSNAKAVEAENAAVITNAIRALSDSTFRDLDLATKIYTVATSNTTVIKNNFLTTAKETLDTIQEGKAEATLLNMIPSGMYGGNKQQSAIEGVQGEPSRKVKVKSLKVGDLLLAETGDAVNNYIYDKDGLVDLSNAIEKVDTNEILANLSNCDFYVVFRPSLVMENYDFITEKSPKLDLTPEQEAVIVTANAYLMRGEKLQYADTYFGEDAYGEYRWKAGYFSPEDYTRDSWGYINCAAFTYDVYYQALGYDLDSGGIKLYTTRDQTDSSEALGIRKYFMLCRSADYYTAEEKERIKEEILDVLQPADMVDGDKLSWTVTLPANSRKQVSYKVKVKPDVPYGATIESTDGMVGGVPVKCAAITVNRTLTTEEQSKISTAIEEITSDETLKGFALVNTIYNKALGIDNIFADTDFATVTTGKSGIYYCSNCDYDSGEHKHIYTLNGSAVYRDMMVPTMYGGRNYLQSGWSDRCRLAREHNLVIGDLLVIKTKEDEQLFIYAGDGKFYDLSDGFAEDEKDAKTRLAATLAAHNFYTILRPSFSMK